MTIPVNNEIDLAYQFILHTNRTIFLTGKAGTGKTAFLHQVKQLSAKRLIVVAPTGVAAINAGGVTIHSLFQFPFGPLIPSSTLRESRKFNKEKIRLLRTLDLLIIDEISMVRADLLDGVDEVLRRYRSNEEPFGGVQLLLIGDLQQLPPVIRDEEWKLLKPYYKTGYFFDSRALRQTTYLSIELTYVYRQTDIQFINLLNSIREKTITPDQLADLNQRHIPEFTPPDEDGYITLSTHNSTVKHINREKLTGLKGPLHSFKAVVKGDFPTNIYPTEASLELKVGAQVMFIKNDNSYDRLYYNGKVGHIVNIDKGIIYVRSQQDKQDIEVLPTEWSNIRYGLDAATKEIKAEVIGSFRQYPLKLAWGITIHKSQGLTFEKVIIDSAAAFAHGQVYVALSRCKTLTGIILRSPILPYSIKPEASLEDFKAELLQQKPTEYYLHEAKRTNQQLLLQELFSFERSRLLLDHCQKVVTENASNLAPDCRSIIQKLTDLLRDKASNISGRFQNQLVNYFADAPLPENNSALQERVRKGSTYFLALIGDEMLPLLRNCFTICENKQEQGVVFEAIEELEKELYVKLRSFEHCQNGFEALAYLQIRNRAELDFQTVGKSFDPRSITTTDTSEDDNLYRALINWRDNFVGEYDQQGSMMLPQKIIVELIRLRPTTLEELLMIKGFGKTKVKQIGNEILSLIKKY